METGKRKVYLKNSKDLCYLISFNLYFRKISGHKASTSGDFFCTEKFLLY